MQRWIVCYRTVHTLETRTRIIIPMRLRPMVLNLAHKCHLDIGGTKQKLRSKVYAVNWETLQNVLCMHANWSVVPSLRSLSEPQHYQLANWAMERFSCWPVRTPANRWIHTGGSRLLQPLLYEIDIMKSTVASRIIESLEEMFSRHGLPESMTSDNGPQFITSEFAAYMEHQGIRHHRVNAKWPQANGEVERQNRSLLKRIQIAHAENKNWKKELKAYLVVPATSVSPCSWVTLRTQDTHTTPRTEWRTRWTWSAW